MSAALVARAALAPVWHVHADAGSWADAAAAEIAAVLRAALNEQAQALLLLSGGSTPEPVYRRLVAAALDWSRVIVSLVDERFVAADHPASNGRLIAAVFGDGASAATIWPLVESGLGIDECVALANQRLADFARPAAAVVFGMGEDGHTASLFPGAVDLAAALASDQAYVRFDASGCPVAGEYPRRITLTPHGWQDARERFLLIGGTRKRRVFEKASAADAVQRYPIQAAIALGQRALVVHWSP